MPEQIELKKWKLINSWDAEPGDEWLNPILVKWMTINPASEAETQKNREFLRKKGIPVRREMTPVEQKAPKVMAAMKKLLKAAEDWDNFDPDWILAAGNARKLMKELSRSR